MDRAYIRGVFALAAITLFSCKTTSQDSSVKAWGLPACKKQDPVEYKDTTRSPNPLSGTGVDLDFFDIVSIQVKPEDFSDLDSHECQENGICTAVLTKPVTVNANIPVTLLSKLALTYEQKKGAEEAVCLREVKVGASVSTPACIGKILKFSLNLGLGVVESQNKQDKTTTYDLKPYCNAKFNCNLPIFTAHAKADENGLTFGSAITGPKLARNAMVKVQAPPQKTDETSLPAPLKQLKEYFHNQKSKLGSDQTSEPDLFWEDLANPCGI